MCLAPPLKKKRKNFYLMLNPANTGLSLCTQTSHNVPMLELVNHFSNSTDTDLKGYMQVLQYWWGRQFKSSFTKIFQMLLSSCPRGGELPTQKLKSHLVRTQSLNILPLKPGVGQYTAIYDSFSKGGAWTGWFTFSWNKMSTSKLLNFQWHMFNQYMFNKQT